jgi:RHS repeat-associated protein
VTVTDALGRVLSYAYDGLGRTTTVTQPDPDGSGLLAAPVTSYGYDNIGNVTSMTDPRGNITLYAYDNLHRVTTVTEADPDDAGPQSPPVTTFSYDAAGQLLATTDPLGRVTGYAYDRLGRTTSVTRPDPDGVGPDASPVTSFGYDSVGNLIAETDPLGNVTLYGYDILSRLTTVTEADPDGAGPQSSPVTTRAYDAAGQLVAFIDQVGRMSTNEYDALGRLTVATGPDPDGAGPELPASMAYAYDRVGNVVAESNRLGHTTTYAYDNLYRLTNLTDANGEDTTFTYDAVDNRLSLTDPSGNTTSWVYDALNRVIEEENELGASRYFAYDVASNLIQRTDRNGRVTQFTYDNLDRQTSEKWMSGATTVKEFIYSYDAAGQLLAAGDGTSDYSYTYDLLGRVTQWTTNLASLPSPVTLGQTFDTASRRTSLFATLGATADFKNEFAYDNLNRLTGLTQQGQSGSNAVAEKRIDFKYLADGRTSEVSRFADVAGTQNVANTTFGYDGAGRLTALTHAKDTTTFAGYGFSFDAANRMTSVTNSVHAAEDAVYTHDDLGQLIGADRTGSGDDEAYVYDEDGNRVTANGDSYTTSANNQIASDGTNSYTYDAEGNITRITNIATGDYRDLTWDYRNRLTKVTQFDASDIEQWRVEYIYDAFNRMVGRTEFTGGSSTPASDDNFIYDGYQMILKLDGSGSVQGRTLWGAGVDQILATEDAAGNVTWPLTDHLNTVRDIVSYDAGTDTTTLENHIVYNSFGEVISETNPSVASDVKFTARYTDATTGFQWNLHRWYVPSIGRWASEDPIGFAAGDPNLARYVGNEPTNAIDPSGLLDPTVPLTIPYPATPSVGTTAGGVRVGPRIGGGPTFAGGLGPVLMMDPAIQNLRFLENPPPPPGLRAFQIGDALATQYGKDLTPGQRSLLGTHMAYCVRDAAILATPRTSERLLAEAQRFAEELRNRERSAADARERLPTAKGTQPEGPTPEPPAAGASGTLPPAPPEAPPAAPFPDDDAPKGGLEIALGKDIPGGGYKQLAEQTGASRWQDWASEGVTRRTVTNHFGRAYHQACERASKIHFSLDGIDDVAAAIKSGKSGFTPGNMTNAELEYIFSNPQMLNKTIFYRNGKIVPSPVLGGP